MSIKPFSTFYFEGNSFDNSSLEARFRYSFDHEVYFEERIDCKSLGFEARKDIDENIIDNLLFHLSMALGISYYKLYPTERLIVMHGQLDSEQKAFWKKFYLQGLGEFLYRNQVSPENLLNFEGSGTKTYKKIPFETRDRYLVPIGGGKDSIVSMEFLKREGRTYDLFTFGKDYRLHEATAKTSGLPHMVVKRFIDPRLFRMNQEGYYNGHVPITGIIAFVLQVVSYLYDYRYNVLSNEKSADSENLIWKGFSINHQYSKSGEFEYDFAKYTQTYMSDVRYFSLLRELYEINIARSFSEIKEYFGVFSSCNNNFKIIEENKTTQDRWCCHCPKCAFVWSILHPWNSDEEMKTIFGKDLYEDSTLLTLFEELLGYSGHKPFECVGTNEEVILAMHVSVERYKEEGRVLPFILSFFRDNILPTLSDEKVQELKEKLLPSFSIKDLLERAEKRD